MNVTQEHVKQILRLIKGPKALAMLQNWGPESRSGFLASVKARCPSDPGLHRAADLIAQSLDAQTIDAKELFGNMANAAKRDQAINQAAATLCGGLEPRQETTKQPTDDGRLSRMEIQLGRIRDQIGELLLRLETPTSSIVGAPDEQDEQTVRQWVEQQLKCPDLTKCRQHKRLVNLTTVFHQLCFTAEQVESVISWLVRFENRYKVHRKE